MRTLENFSAVVLCDFEYHHGGPKEGPPQIPLCACALELRSGREYRLWQDELERLRVPPWPHGPDSLFVTYNASAELSCYLELDWPLPRFILDLLIEHRQLTNGRLSKNHKRDLVTALQYYKLPAIDPMEKEDWHTLILTGGPFTAEQQAGILDYCWTDVEALRRLMPEILKQTPRDLDRALFRSRYTIPATYSQQTGIPIDVNIWERLLDQREKIQRHVTKDCPVYDEHLVFKLDRLDKLLAQLELEHRWPRTPDNHPSTEDKTFRKFLHIPEIEQLHETRQVKDQLDKPSFSVTQGRNYYRLLPYKAETSRNVTLSCIYQAPKWMRGLIQPSPGSALAYIDFEQEEFLIAGVLAKDDAIIHAYASGDPYIGFGVTAGFIPAGATKDTHPNERDHAKTLMIAILYGMSARRLAISLNISLNRAQDLMRHIRQLFGKTWDWSNTQVRTGYWTRSLETVYGWPLAVTRQTRNGTLRNFKVQGCGAEILRLASIFLWEAGIRVCVPVHDAVLVECPEAELGEVVQEARRLMERAGEVVLKGHRLRTDVREFRYPDRLVEKKGLPMWKKIIGQLSVT